MKTVYIFTDGACSGNPGPGGWGAILKYNDKEKHISGGEKLTTNNRMELKAVIEALKALKEECHVIITTDSKYVCDAVNKGWAQQWKNNCWKKADKKPALNSEMWDELLSLTEKHTVEFKWVRGHNGHPENELCDKMAVSEWEKFR